MFYSYIEKRIKLFFKKIYKQGDKKMENLFEFQFYSEFCKSLGLKENRAKSLEIYQNFKTKIRTGIQK